ncbi:hypothetical protein [Curtobacterium sp. ZW137]|uniref:hypothetical protein n=1 Tax=Curtobacterium sp. ZW137 TaxID=2485104 RepID=UPI000F4C5D13|nr:hypothetical protein [Curtobacterium sp. ZW137]ROP63288.1 hypothetical protein EDF55_2042 [Curtobacterium sp. ZW137]
MNRNRLSLIIALVVAVGVLAGGWFLGVQPQLAAASANSTQQQDIDATNAANRLELTRLAKAYTELDQTKADLARLRSSVPETADTTPFLKALDFDATNVGVTITSITLDDAVVYAPPSDAAGSSTAGEPTASASATSAPSPAGMPTTAATPSATAPHTDSSITGANFSLIPVTVSVTGSYDQALAFTKAVQKGERLFLVSAIAATSDAEDGNPMDNQAWSLSGSIYVLAEASATSTASPAATPRNG